MIPAQFPKKSKTGIAQLSRSKVVFNNSYLIISGKKTPFFINVKNCQL